MVWGGAASGRLEGRGRLCEQDAVVYGAGDGGGVWGLGMWGGAYVVDWTEVVSVGQALRARMWGDWIRGSERFRMELKARWLAC